MPDWVISLGINALLNVVRNNAERSRWRKALLKLFREIAVAMESDEEFREIARSIGKVDH
jgi:hypothetical protein